ncbi:MAG: radical SAM protein [bacterium]|nr:radical SAM protein [bacterium]
MGNRNVEAREFRRMALGLIDPGVQPMPSRPTVAFVWPTELCSIACAHCSFGSQRAGTPKQRLLADHPEALVKWFADAGGTKLVVCGGGEPLDEPEFVVRAIAASSQLGVGFEVYTSGYSLLHPTRVEEYIRDWGKAWASGNHSSSPFAVRLSVDSFHEDRIGLEPVAAWIQNIERQAPDWRVSVRSIRVEREQSVARLATLLGARVQPIREWSAWMVLPSGRRVFVEWKGFVYEGRGRGRVLEKRGISHTFRDAAVLEPLIAEFGPDGDLGRPLSARLTVTHRRIDLEIHSDCVVHILETQAPDLRLSMLDRSWEDMRAVYYRDPILHRVVESGLPAVAELIVEAHRMGVSQEPTVPFSIERLTDPAMLGWVTASALLANGDRFQYPDSLRDMARRFLSTDE